MAKAVLPAMTETHQVDWMDAANCLVEDVSDTSFLYEPDEVSDRRWARICSKCQVFNQCATWADRFDIRGTYIAGEWRP